MCTTENSYKLDISQEDLGGFHAKLCHGDAVITVFNSLQIVNVLNEVWLYAPASASVELRWNGVQVCKTTVFTLTNDAEPFAERVLKLSAPDSK